MLPLHDTSPLFKDPGHGSFIQKYGCSLTLVLSVEIALPQTAAGRQDGNDPSFLVDVETCFCPELAPVLQGIIGRAGNASHAF